MSFSENLKRLRKEHHLSQEELSELLAVSRQAVSKWEQGMGYPEVETLLLLAAKLNVSLDTLMLSEVSERSAADREGGGGMIVILSPNEKAAVTCSKVMASGKMRGGKRAPQYALFGASGTGSAFWGEPTTFLGWYANEEQITREMEEICAAIETGRPSYTLQYSAKTERRWTGLKLVDE